MFLAEDMQVNNDFSFETQQLGGRTNINGGTADIGNDTISSPGKSIMFQTNAGRPLYKLVGSGLDKDDTNSFISPIL